VALLLLKFGLTFDENTGSVSRSVAMLPPACLSITSAPHYRQRRWRVGSVTDHSRAGDRDLRQLGRWLSRGSLSEGGRRPRRDSRADGDGAHNGVTFDLCIIPHNHSRCKVAWLCTGRMFARARAIGRATSAIQTSWIVKARDLQHASRLEDLPPPATTRYATRRPTDSQRAGVLRLRQLKDPDRGRSDCRFLISGRSCRNPCMVPRLRRRLQRTVCR